MKNILQLPRIIRYGIAGIVGTTLNLGVYAFCLYVVQIWYIAAAIVAFSAAVMVSFLLQRHWTFGDTSTDKEAARFASFAAIGIGNTLLNAMLLFLFVEFAGIHKLLGQIFSTAIIAVSSFFLYKYLVFPPSETLTVGAQQF